MHRRLIALGVIVASAIGVGALLVALPALADEPKTTSCQIAIEAIHYDTRTITVSVSFTGAAVPGRIGLWPDIRNPFGEPTVWNTDVVSGTVGTAKWTYPPGWQGADLYAEVIAGIEVLGSCRRSFLFTDALLKIYLPVISRGWPPQAPYDAELPGTAVGPAIVEWSGNGCGIFALEIGTSSWPGTGHWWRVENLALLEAAYPGHRDAFLANNPSCQEGRPAAPPPTPTPTPTPAPPLEVVAEGPISGTIEGPAIIEWFDGVNCGVCALGLGDQQPGEGLAGYWWEFLTMWSLGQAYTDHRDAYLEVHPECSEMAPPPSTP